MVQYCALRVGMWRGSGGGWRATSPSVASHASLGPLAATVSFYSPKTRRATRARRANAEQERNGCSSSSQRKFGGSMDRFVVGSLAKPPDVPVCKVMRPGHALCHALNLTYSHSDGMQKPVYWALCVGNPRPPPPERCTLQRRAWYSASPDGLGWDEINQWSDEYSGLQPGKACIGKASMGKMGYTNYCKSPLPCAPTLAAAAGCADRRFWLLWNQRRARADIPEPPSPLSPVTSHWPPFHDPCCS